MSFYQIPIGNGDYTQIILSLASMAFMITVFILFYSRPPRYIGPLVDNLSGQARAAIEEIAQGLLEEVVVIAVGGKDPESGQELPGLIEVGIDKGVKKLFDTMKYSAMGEESGVSKRVSKMKANIVMKALPMSWKVGAKHLLGWDEEFISENTDDILAVMADPQVRGLLGSFIPGQEGGAPALPQGSRKGQVATPK